MACASLLRERDRRRHAGLVAVHPRGVALARRVLDEAGVARTEDLLGAVAEADLELAGQDDDELPPRRRMPVDEAPDRILAEGDLRRGEPLDPVGMLAEIDRLEVRLPVTAGIKAKGTPRRLLI
jgi:hypothetical protein